MAILFDLDGTLVDTAPDLLATLNAMLRDLGRDPVPMSQVGYLVGHGARAMIERAMSLTGRPASEQQLDSLLARFLEIYATRIADESRPYDGVEAALEHLAREGYILAVCTNKPTALATQLLDRLRMRRYFTHVAGGDHYPVRKPDAGHILRLVADVGSEPARTVMIGDSIPDVEAARAAQVPVIAMSHGYAPMPAAELGADHVAAHFDEVPGAVRSLLGRK